MAFKYGRLAPHPEETHPRVHLSSHLRLPAVKIPAVVDRASKVDEWPMLLNDQLGDCTCAGAGHALQAWTAYGKGEFTPTDAEVLSMYEAVSGYDPSTGANDNGAVEQDVLQYFTDTGLGGHKIVAFAQVDPSNLTEMKAALEIFGSVYLGILVPESMQEQFAAGQPIDYVPGSQIEGGHCVVIQKWDTVPHIVTWGSLVEMTEAFWAHYGEEAWVIVTQDFLDAKGDTPDGLSLSELMVEFNALKAPAPVPAPVQDVENIFEKIWSWLKRLF